MVSTSSVLDNDRIQFQMFGHHRSPSMEEFKEVTQRDAEIRMASELDKLRKTARTDAEAKNIDMQVKKWNLIRMNTYLLIGF